MPSHLLLDLSAAGMVAAMLGLLGLFLTERTRRLAAELEARHWRALARRGRVPALTQVMPLFHAPKRTPRPPPLPDQDG